ncbi:Bicoid-interacting protein 3-domain-containing protein [Cyathus striatus]|nr:Bicoid-interacting protein 3-domain-containing protein [Cyathus striatus]
MSNPIHGNYHGYYSKRPHATTDTRLALLPDTLFQNKHVLDIGCNEGWVTCEIAQLWGACKVTGVDIDDSLIQAAWRRRRTVWSLQAPTSPSYSDVPPKKKPRTEPAPVPNYFPASLEHTLGSLPIPPPPTADKNLHDIPEDKDGYDVVLAFVSITKWIHLHTLDAGLLSFFRRIFSVLRQGGVLVLEPQPWESYAKARRMSDTLKQNYKSLTLRPENFPDVLKEIGFSKVRHYGSVGDGGFCRPIDVYVKP